MPGTGHVNRCPCCPWPHCPWPACCPYPHCPRPACCPAPTAHSQPSLCSLEMQASLGEVCRGANLSSLLSLIGKPVFLKLPNPRLFFVNSNPHDDQIHLGCRTYFDICVCVCFKNVWFQITWFTLQQLTIIHVLEPKVRTEMMTCLNKNVLK